MQASSEQRLGRLTGSLHDCSIPGVRLSSFVVLAWLVGCRCGGPLQNVEPPQLSVTPASLSFPATWVGRSATLTLEVSNSGASATLAPSITGPFTLSTTSLTVARGETETIAVRFEPSTAGAQTGVVSLAEGLTVPIVASAMEPPVCLASATCFESSFDFEAAMCVERQQPVGSACATTCVTGSCSGATCVGTSRSCDDGDACTIDACDEALGCVSTPRTCQASSNPCLETRCDPQLGCVTNDAPDGVICGRDDCLATQVDVCVSGACVTRVRPASARCTNRWVPLAPESDAWLAWDGRRGRVVMLSRSGLTWELLGSTWVLRTPLAKPLFGGPLQWNPLRQRVTMVVRTGIWEWDGATWVFRQTPLPAGGSLAFDDQGRAILIDLDRPSAGATWEWNGAQWTLRSTTGPTDGRFVHYDEVRRQIVAPADRLAWNGQAWQPIPSSVAPSCTGTFARDSRRHRLVVGCQTETWEWDGATWTSAAGRPPLRAFGELVFDGTTGRVLSFGGESGDTWEWNGSTWSEIIGPTNPPLLGTIGGSLAWDSRRRQLVLGQRGDFAARFWSPDGGRWQEWPDAGIRLANVMSLTPDVDGGLLMLADSEPFVTQPLTTWTWDGTSWARHPTTIPRRQHPGLTTDRTRGRVVLFGGWQPSSDDTWEWDGTTWAQRMAAPPAGEHNALSSSPSGVVLTTILEDGGGSTWSWSGLAWSPLPAPHQPPATLSTMAFDPVRNKTLLYEDYNLPPRTWEWAGSDWVVSTIEDTPRGSSRPSMAFDEANQRMTLWNGSIWVLLP